MSILSTPLSLSIQTAIYSTVITFFLGIFAAKKVMRLNKSRAFVDGVFTLPLVLPPTVVGFYLLILLGTNGPFASIYNFIGTQLIFSYPSTVISAVVVSFPLMYRTALGAFDQVDKNILDAGRTLGFSETRLFWKILLPSSYPGLISGVILTFARSMGEFGATIMIAGNIPGRTQTLSTAIYSAVQAGNRELAFKWSLLVVLMAFASMIAINFVGRKGVKL